MFLEDTRLGMVTLKSLVVVGIGQGRDCNVRLYCISQDKARMNDRQGTLKRTALVG